MRKLVLLSLGLVLAAATSALAGPDTYSGDAAIYSAISNDTNRPNILFIIDNSRATKNYVSTDPYDPTTTYTGTYDSDSIYVVDVQGDDWNLLSSTLTLDGVDGTHAVSCVGQKEVTVDGSTTTLNVDVNHILGNNGTYTGSGNEWYPNLDTTGSCDSAPKGDTYATGNYLNYLSQSIVTDETSVYVTNWHTNGNKQGAYELVESHEAAASNEPPHGADWEVYWREIVRDTNAPNSSAPASAEPWALTDADGNPNYYQMPAVSADTAIQREVVYKALETVITGARGEVNFGAMIYDTQGAKTIADMADLREDTDLLTFLGKLPQTSRNSDDSINYIPTGTEPLENVQRPQAEALVDAGYYLETVYPGNLVSINSTSKIGQVGDMVNPCDYDHIILLTNGLPNEDGDPKITDISDPDGDYDGDAWPDESVYGQGSHYLDDVANYLNVEGNITTHTILAFQSADPLIANAAEDGDGDHYVVQNANKLQEALQNLLNNIVAEKDTSFVAPVVPASTTNRTISSNRVYLGLFKPQIKGSWHGNLKKYGIDTSNRLLDANGDYATDSNGDFIVSSVSYWSDQGGVIPSAGGDRALSEGDGGIVDAGGAGGALLKQSSRNIYTYLNSSNSNVTTADANISNSQNHLDIFNSDVLFDSTLEVADQAARNRLLLFLEGLAAYKAEYDDTIDWSTIHDTTSSDIASIEKENWIMGDVLHSKPLVFNYSPYGESVEGVCESDVASGDPHNSSVVYVGANDGMLHAINDCDGTERWAFVPPILLNDLQHLSKSGHVPFVDSPPTAYVHDTDDDGTIESGDGDKVILLFGLRRGGGSNFALSATDSDDERLRGAYYALDVTDPDNPNMLWEITSDTTDTIDGTASDAFEELGEAWSQPRLAKVKVGSAKVIAAFFGAGYDVNDNLRYGKRWKYPAKQPDGVTVIDESTDFADSTDDAGYDSSGNPKHSYSVYGSSTPAGQVNPRGRGLYAVEVARLTDPDSDGNLTPDFTNTGDKLWGATYDSTTQAVSSTSFTHTEMWWPIPSDITVIDKDSDGYADTIYAGDTGAQMWRFNIGDSNRINWKADVIFWGDQTTPFGGRKIYYKPAVAIINSNPWLFFGTGDRAHPLNLGVEDHMIALIDRGQGYENDGYFITPSSLVDVTTNTLQESSDPTEVQSVLDDLNAETNYGWFIRLKESGHTGEKVLAEPTVYNGEVFFSTYQPNLTNTDPCAVGNLGTSRLYHLDYKTGEAVFNYDLANDSDTVDEDSRALGEDGAILKRSDRVRTLGEGIPSGIVTLIDASGHVTMMISSSNKVDTSSAPDSRLITPVYWMQW